MPLPTRQNDRGRPCDFCGCTELEVLYTVPGSVNGSQVVLCLRCGLLQSLQTRNRDQRQRRVAVSGGADWGNIRYGKGFRTAEALRIIAAVRPLTSLRHCLDIGANRGDFLLELLHRNPAVRTVAVEPDTTVIGTYQDDPRIRLQRCRFEDVELDGQFDFIYCCHTLEHVDSPAAFLSKVHGLMSNDGLLYLEVPDLAIITVGDVVEEFFIDKHTFHFTPNSLARYLALYGFTAIHHEISGSNIIYLLGKGVANPSATIAAEVAEIAKTKESVSTYRANMARNVQTLMQIGAYLNGVRKRMVFWGAGRIFDSLMRVGGVDRRLIAGVVDKYLPDYVPSVHGFHLVRPGAIDACQPELIIITSREYAAEIREEITRIHPGEIEVVDFSQLMERFAAIGGESL